MIATAFCAALALGGGAPAQPQLTHSAPWLGEVLWVHLSDLQVGQPATLWVSGAAASIPTPIGLLELDLATAFPLVTAFPQLDGGFDVPLLLPPEPALAEAELHFQALALSTQVPEGAILSQAAHLRLLASRVVVEQLQVLDFMGPETRRLSVRSAVDLQPTFEISMAGTPGRERELRLSPDARFAAYSYGDVTSSTVHYPQSGGTVRFDHYFGAAAVEDTLVTRGEWVEAPWGEAWLVYGYDPAIAPGWDLYSLPYDPALPPTPLGIGGGVGPMVADLAGDAAWIPDDPTVLGEQRMKRVSLTTGATLTSVVVSHPSQPYIEWAEVVGERLIVATTAPQTGPDDAHLQLGWVDWASAPTGLQVWNTGDQRSRYDGRLSLTGDLLFWGWGIPPFPAIFLDGYLLDAALPGAATELTSLFYLPNSPTVVADHGATVWLFDRCCDDPPDSDGPATLWLIDPFSGAMSSPAGSANPVFQVSSPLYTQYVSMASIEDFTGFSLVFGGSTLDVVPVQWSDDNLLRYDPFTGAQEVIDTGLWSNVWMESVSAP